MPVQHGFSRNSNLFAKLIPDGSNVSTLPLPIDIATEHLVPYVSNNDLHKIKELSVACNKYIKPLNKKNVSKEPRN